MATQVHTRTPLYNLNRALQILIFSCLRTCYYSRGYYKEVWSMNNFKFFNTLTDGYNYYNTYLASMETET